MANNAKFGCIKVDSIELAVQQLNLFNGRKEWWSHGILQRVDPAINPDGSAVTDPDGTGMTYGIDPRVFTRPRRLGGGANIRLCKHKRHREDVPACIGADGTEWYIHSFEQEKYF